MRLASFVAGEQAKQRRRVENICGVLVHARPEKSRGVCEALAGLPGVELHAATPEGKLVLTVEDAGDSWAGATITRIAEIEGVANVALVYHHFDSELEGETVR